MDREEPPREKLTRTPIRKCYVVNGERPDAHRTVFCGRQQRSVDVDECIRCARFESESSARELSPSLVCRQDVPDMTRLERRALAPIALVMGTHTVCVRPDAPIERVRGLLVGPNTTIPIVDRARTLVGVVSARELMALLPFVPQVCTAEDVMAPRDLRLDERTTILDAAAFMSAKRLRSAVVVDANERVVAIVDDIALLHWVGTHHV